MRLNFSIAKFFILPIVTGLFLFAPSQAFCQNKNIENKKAQEEKEKAAERLKTGVEITRFKGLGEISPSEFGAFIGDKMRLDHVKLAEEESISDIMAFYMGDNTVERQVFIRENLRSEEELEDVNI